MSKIKWPDIDKPYDLCTRINGIYADIMSAQSGWYCLWDNRFRVSGFANRPAAIAWFDKNIADLKRGRIPSDMEESR
jgi:hypothetical protein